jgi:hypothetical protein
MATLEKQESSLSQKTKQALEALRTINRALILKPESPRIALQKIQIASQLIPFACAEQNYALAHYIIADLETLSSSFSTQKTRLKQALEDAQTKQLKQHLKRFEFWKRKLALTSTERRSQEFPKCLNPKL